MNDKELLELAAKAAGLVSQGGAGYVGGLYLDSFEFWNPLLDDGDAFRLAVKLSIKYEGHVNQPFVAAWAPEIVGRFEEPEGSDPFAATRRVIVKAAAEIGLKMTT